jgi:uncharacterized protein DUF488
MIRQSKKLDIRLKRAYLSSPADDGVRVVVGRLWPRGVRKSKCCHRPVGEGDCSKHGDCAAGSATTQRRWDELAGSVAGGILRRYLESGRYEMQASLFNRRSI